MSLFPIVSDPSRRQLLVFGVVWFAFFGLAGIGISGRAAPAVAVALWATAVLVPLVGWKSPRILREIYRGMSYATFPIGFVLSLILLAAVYYLVLTPIGILMRTIGHDPLKRFDEGRAESFWVPRDADDRLERYFRQF